MASQTVPTSERPPPWRDVRIIRIVGQVVFAIFVVVVLAVLWNNLVVNMSNRSLPTGFSFLDQPAGFQVRDTEVTSRTSILRVILVGVKNTALVSFVGILVATVLGVLIGIARLSENWLVRKSAALYVETIRNIPVLVIIIFFGVAIVAGFPQITAPTEVPGLLISSNRGTWVPWVRAPEGESGGLAFIVALLIALAVAVAVAIWRTRVNERTGQPHHRILYALATFVVLGAIGYLVLGAPVSITTPSREGRVVTGGIAMSAPYLGLLLGLSIYTASHIAEIVRGSILAVPNGQSEAAQAVALTGFQRMRYVVLPQATRIMVPPLANQYLNLTKNSSLGIALAYAEITTISQIVIGNGRPAPQLIGIAMVFYLAFSLFISALTNAYNRRIQYVTR